MRYFINRDIGQVIAVEDKADQFYIFSIEIMEISADGPAEEPEEKPKKRAGGGRT